MVSFDMVIRHNFIMSSDGTQAHQLLSGDALCHSRAAAGDGRWSWYVGGRWRRAGRAWVPLSRRVWRVVWRPQEKLLALADGDSLSDVENTHPMGHGDREDSSRTWIMYTRVDPFSTPSASI
jgi:hypothetical protein